MFPSSEAGRDVGSGCREDVLLPLRGKEKHRHDYRHEGNFLFPPGKSRNDVENMRDEIKHDGSADSKALVINISSANAKDSRS